MTSTLAQLSPATAEREAARFPRVDIVVPVYNEQAGLERSVRRLHDFLTRSMPYAWRIVIGQRQYRRDSGDRPDPRRRAT